MIISRTPFRVSFAGGGTDLSFYYRQFGGCVISMSIDRYIYLSAHPMFFSNEILLKYSKTERPSLVSSIEHNLFREALTHFKVQGIDISVSSDIPSGTGLGSSSAFSVGLCHLLSAYKSEYLTPSQLSELACSLENKTSGQAVGKQDQYASAIGGMNLIHFNPDDSVDYQPLFLSSEVSNLVASCCFLVFVGNSRSAKKTLDEIFSDTKTESIRIKQLTEIKNILVDSLSSIRQNPFHLGEVIKESWNVKKEFASNDEIDQVIDFGLKNGATGGKLLGAGKGGFVLFFVPQDFHRRFLDTFQSARILKMGVDYSGSTIIYSK